MDSYAYEALRNSGMTPADIEAMMRREAAPQIEGVASRILSHLSANLEDRIQRGEAILAGFEEYPDITVVAKERIAASKEEYERFAIAEREANVKIDDLKKIVADCKKKRGELEEKLKNLEDAALKRGQEHEEPSWMAPGTLDRMRAAGRNYAERVSRK